MKGMKFAVTDHGNNRVQVFISDSNYVRSFSTNSDKLGEFNWPNGQGIVLIDKNGYIVVEDSSNHLVQGFSQQGERVPKPVWW